MVASIGLKTFFFFFFLVKNRVTKNQKNKKPKKKPRTPPSFPSRSRPALSNATSEAAFTQVNDKSLWPRVKYTTVWQVVKVPQTHAQQRAAS